MIAYTNNFLHLKSSLLQAFVRRFFGARSSDDVLFLGIRYAIRHRYRGLGRAPGGPTLCVLRRQQHGLDDCARSRLGACACRSP